MPSLSKRNARRTLSSNLLFRLVLEQPSSAGPDQTYNVTALAVTLRCKFVAPIVEGETAKSSKRMRPADWSQTLQMRAAIEPFMRTTSAER